MMYMVIDESFSGQTVRLLSVYIKVAGPKAMSGKNWVGPVEISDITC